MKSGFGSGKSSSARRLALGARWTLNAIAVIAVLLITDRVKWPNLLFDNVSLILFAIGAGVVVLPYLVGLLPSLKTLKAGPLDAVFEQEFLQFERSPVASEAKPPKPRVPLVESAGTVSWEKYFDKYFRTVNSPAQTWRIFLALASCWITYFSTSPRVFTSQRIGANSWCDLVLLSGASNGFSRWVKAF